MHSPVDYFVNSIARLIVHYCNLFSVDNVMELILYIVRHLPTTQHPSEHRTMTAAKHQLNMKFANDPSKTRKLVWHAAQIHAVANEYVVSAPCEILRVFMGAILLLAFSKYCPKLAASDEGSASDRPMVFLDRLDPTNTQAGLVEVWIKHGGPASLSGVSDIHSSELAATVCRRTQGLLEKAQCWGLSNKFVKILHMFQDAEI
ncbi:hypothetical protein N7468_007870 [Penicillium chermesinum]|uniref:Uncharacterized protein n=1 Tax=Penicillium chermesinum TaxID=63820 RepID=A0A9W9NR08_9EURO|nr:uncharacterized protein N7468_007870 [Penicillium chermesinum]KAJ5223328.1 hypothetical protein N7468_007870 [Penicillium chermesinum]